ncbi:MAG: phosphoenolpyruvate synthase [Geobacteraceae bacterium GWC2_55_20]|nr:MAG: phosphoenolpyruvate synthase [Geobacteraceae bacterium GWC2_55_20]HCE67991.1 phosphoenolpyruvate synthase [Geobacter sp.]
MSAILTIADGSARSLMGGKAGALAALACAELPIPPWFVVSCGVCRDLLPVDLAGMVEYGAHERLCAALDRLVPGDELCREIAAALAHLCPNGEPVAVRSSALDEDGSEHSFAGQLDSFLFVPPAEVPDKVAAVWRSGFNERVLSYRREKGLPLHPPLPAVLVQRMVTSDMAGVAFSADPVSGQRGIAVVSGVYGIGTALVSGESDADTWRVDLGGRIFDEQIAEKRMAHRADPYSHEGVSAVPVSSESAKRPCLTAEQVRSVADLARRAARHFGRPQDIEWGIENGALYLLQSRPITSLAGLPDPDGGLNIWDNSNIAESYGGVTTPLTFSFARHIYEEVYRQFCRIMAVPTAAITANERIFPRMLGMVRGRIYYNLLNWYRLLALLPGFSTNRRFMEQMMGVKEGIPDEILAGAVATYRVAPWRDRMNLLGSLIGLVHNLRGLKTSIPRFYQRLNTALAPPDPPLDGQRPDELTSHYRMLETQLLTRWDAPLVNDFFAMVFYGLLRKLTASWCNDTLETLQNDLLSGEGGMISAEPARRVRQMAVIAAADSLLTELLATGDAMEINRAVAAHAQLGPLYDAYLEKFGDRCLDELKLESATLHDDPLPLQRSIGEFARRINSKGAGQPPDESAIRRAAEDQVNAMLRGNPLRRIFFKWVLEQARARVRDRENLRFERTRLFGRVRRVFVELGRRFHADGILNDPRDIFWLEKDEILGFVEGTASSVNLRGLAALRRAEFDGWRELDPPADRFDTHGMVSHAQPCRSTVAAAEAPRGDTLKGIGCCPGVVRGSVRVITDPRGAIILQGEILVAERTDPGWIMLFPACSGLLVERGSLLSHSAIVAREMGIPAVVSIPGITAWLKTGDLVEMDGGSGVVRKL